MNICLITWIGSGNYGTSLQSYALHSYLENQGYKISFLHGFRKKNIGFGDFKTTIYLPNKSLRAIVKDYILFLFCKTIKKRKVYSFNRDNYHHLYVTNKRQYVDILEQTDIFLTGSDQIWNCYHGFDPFMFLEFIQNKKKVAYASSIGASDFPKAYEDRIKSDLIDFDYIGVREKRIIKYLNSLLERNDIVQVLDPTFLLDEKQWREFSLKGEIEIKLPQSFIFCYFVGDNPDYFSQLKRIQKDTKIDNILLIPSLENSKIDFPDCIKYVNAGPYEFVYLLDKAKYICTDSFHACALAINLSKNFSVFKRFSDRCKESQNSRIYDLLDIFDLNDRIGFSTDAIDYSKVHEKLQNYRKSSMTFLKEAFK